MAIVTSNTAHRSPTPKKTDPASCRIQSQNEEKQHQQRADIEIICIKYDTILIAKFIVGERRREINTRYAEQMPI